MAQNQVEELLNARAQIDEQLRRHKNVLTVMFTDVVGSTSYFERFGDTAGLAMVHLSAELGSSAVTKFGGNVVKTIGDSVMGDFPEPLAAVHAAVEMQRQLIKMNSGLPEHKRLELRIGIHSGMGFRKGNDVFGDVVNLAARITKRTEAAQILISRAVWEAVSAESDFSCRWLDKCTIDGRNEKEDVFEVVWTEVEAYNEIRRKLTSSEPSGEAHTKKIPGQTSLPSRYEVLDKVGHGGVGIVYKVRDLETSEVLALKVLKPEIASDPVAQANFSKELCLARRITHKNVCRIYDLYRQENTAYASMEYVHGENLLKLLLIEGRMPVDKSLEILKQICAGLSEAHAQGVVHRDLKPANIMIDRSGTVKIMDFGIARLVEAESGHTGSITGTPAYMAPEQAAGKPVDARTDIYALGLLLYEMVTGNPAFSGDTTIATALKQITEQPRAPRELAPGVPEHVETIILKCLEKEPARRFASVSELEKALAQRPEAASEVSMRPNTRARSAASAGVTAVRSATATAEVAEVVGSKVSLVQIARESGEAWAKELQKMVSNLHLGEKLARCQDQLTTFMKQPMPKYLTLGSRRFTPQHVAAIGGSVVVVLAVAMTAAGHAKKAHATTTISHNASAVTSLTTPPSTGSQTLASSALAPVAATAATPIDANAKAKTNNLSPTALSDPSSTSTPARKNPAVAKKPKMGAKPLILASLTAPKPVVPVASPALPSTLDAPTEVTDANTAGEGQLKIAGPNEADTFFEVGSFKDAKWADDASNTLEKFGYHVHVSHKGHLWMNAYHVLVGPYRDEAAMNAARLSLEARGYTPRPIH